MTSENFELKVTISTSDGEHQDYNYSWKNTTICQVRNEMTPLVIGIIRPLCKGGGIIQVSSDGMVYNCVNVIKVLFEASPDKFQEVVIEVIKGFSASYPWQG